MYSSVAGAAAAVTTLLGATLLLETALLQKKEQINVRTNFTGDRVSLRDDLWNDLNVTNEKVGKTVSIHGSINTRETKKRREFHQ